MLFGDNDLPLARPDAAKPSPRVAEEAAAAAAAAAATAADAAEAAGQAATAAAVTGTAALSPDEAAVLMQCMVRCWAARERCYHTAQSVYEKLYDDEHDE